MTPLRRLTLVPLLAFALLGAPAPASSAADVLAPIPPPHQRVTYTYHTFFDPGSVSYDQIDSFTVVYGTLILTFNPDRTIRGTYTPNFGKAQVVTGHLMTTGALHFWVGGHHFVGQFTPHGIAVVSTTLGSSSSLQLWGRFVHA
ncbi:MAG: hypothetical protein ABR975_01670 [Vulcanimicrobiaceae bacterium]|jgi:hypothetical protein